jgi:hypothetical protein
MAAKRPRRGPSGNVIVTGDTGPRQPQGGAKPGASESGDLQAREFGVPQADLPGGVKHLVNPESPPERTTDKPRRPADYHKYHGVPSDDGQYAVTPGVEKDRPPKPVPEPKFNEAVPVYIVEGQNQKNPIRRLITEGPQTIAANTVDPVRIAARDPHRVKLWICNENSTFANLVRIGDWATTADGRGLAIPGGSSPRDFLNQDDLFLINPSGSAIVVSWGWETEVEAST